MQRPVGWNGDGGRGKASKYWELKGDNDKSMELVDKALQLDTRSPHPMSKIFFWPMSDDGYRPGTAGTLRRICTRDSSMPSPCGTSR